MPSTTLKHMTSHDGPTTAMEARALRLRRTREGIPGLTQQMVADKLGDFNRGSITAWEGARAEPSYDTIIRLAKIYNVTPEWLAFGVFIINGVRKVKL